MCKMLHIMFLGHDIEMENLIAALKVPWLSYFAITCHIVAE